TMATDLALQQASQGAALSTAWQNAESTVENYFGGLSDLAGTALLNLGDASCAAGASQASFDASLLLDGIAQLAANFKVTSAALVLAIIQDVVSDGVLDGLAAGVPIEVPLAAGGGSVPLTTIYGSSLAQSLEAAVSTFAASAANACKATQSQEAKTRMDKSQSQALANAQYNYIVSGTYTATTGGTAYGNPSPVLQMTVKMCSGDTAVPVHPVSLALGYGSVGADFELYFYGTNATFSDDNGDFGGSYSNNIDWSNACGTGSWNLSVTSPPGFSCSIAQGSTSGTFTSTDSGDHNSFTEPTNVVVNCNALAYSIGGTISGLPTNTTVTLTDTVSGASFNAMVAGPQGTTTSENFVLDKGNLVQNNPFDIVITAPAGLSCTFPNKTTEYSGVINQASITNLTVTCSSSGGGGGGGGPVTLNGPGGMVFYKGLLYVTNGGGNQVLIFSETLSGKTVSAITQVGVITSPNMTDPARIAIDASGYLYVGSLGTGNGTGTVTVYDTNDGNAEVTAAGGKALLSGLDRPLGIAVDGSYYLYVADNAGDTISVYVPVTAGKPSAGYASPINLTQDKSGNSFLAPGVIYEQNLSSILGAGNDYLMIGFGPSDAPDSVILYNAPFTAPPAPSYDLTNATCATMPSGPTAIALYADLVDPILSSIYIASNYNNNVVQYSADNFIGKLGNNSVNTCPTPVTNNNGINHVEGLAVDAVGNVFVSNAGSSGTNANTIAVYPGGWSSDNTPPYLVYPPQ
ncbi:MAG TPA: hypothetical protein VK437_16380, partial [Steroidobacteraceae bacterium]|nr:hypothetical protein [Steroidobacteraceae bacterium]